MSNGMRVLLIEDESDLRTLLSYNLEASGYQVRAVENGKAGAAQLRRARSRSRAAGPANLRAAKRNPDPGLLSADARLEKAFTLRRYKLNAFLDVQNVTNRRNAEEIIYRFDFSRRAYISGLPTLAVLGLRLEF
jgi:CheY-like chemotaxis protein